MKKIIKTKYGKIFIFLVSIFFLFYGTICLAGMFSLQWGIWQSTSIFSLVYSAGANGSLTGSVSQTVNRGASGSAVTAVPNAGYHFVNWSNDNSTQNPRMDINVQGNVSVTANFALDWQTVGTTEFSPASYSKISFALDSNNVPYAAFQDNATNKANVMKYDGSSWVNVGTAGFSPGTIQSISLALDSNNVPYVGYEDNANSQKVTVMKYNGSAWVGVGSAGFSADRADDPVMVLDSSNNPYVAYEDQAQNFNETVMKWNGSTWVNVGSAGFSTPIAGAAGTDVSNIALDSNNVPYVAFQDYGVGGDKLCTVMKYSGGSWSVVGASKFFGGTYTDISIAFDSTNNPYVGFLDGAHSNKASVMKYNGSSWVNIGSAGFSGGTAVVSTNGLAFNSSNVPYLTYEDAAQSNKITVMKYNGSSWVNVGNAGFSASTAVYPAIALDSNNIPYVAYVEYASGKITVKKYTGP